MLRGTTLLGAKAPTSFVVKEVTSSHLTSGSNKRDAVLPECSPVIAGSKRYAQKCSTPGR